MRKIIRRILQGLDGTPQVYGHQSKGQSLVELALVLPLIIMLLVGLVEIGWFARNYMTLLEVTRVGARRAATLQEEYSPIQWDRLAIKSTLPLSEMSLSPAEQTDPRFDAGVFTPEYMTYLQRMRDYYRNCDAVAAGQVDDLPSDVDINAYPTETDDSDPEPIIGGFYNIVLCQMLLSMDPLSIDETNGIDDIVISVFSVLTIDNNERAAGGDIDLLTTNQIFSDEFATRGHIPVVVGRFPKNANECNVWDNLSTPATADAYYGFGGDTDPNLIFERDPFDYYDQTGIGNTKYVSTAPIYTDLNGDGAYTPDEIDDYPLELAELIVDPVNPDDSYWQSIGYDHYNQPEVQRGFMMVGQHQPPVETRSIGGSDHELVCFGSEWDIYRVQEELLGGGFVLSQEEIDNIRAFNPGFCEGDGGPATYCDQREYLPPTGLVLVEVFWQHQLLLDLPVFSPIQGFTEDQRVIRVWSAFPTPSVIPDVRYNVDEDQVLEVD